LRQLYLTTMQAPQVTHHIQLDILRKMLQAPESRYSDLKPKEIESNLFLYHLGQLKKIGLIEKQDKSYVLTRAGKHFADTTTLKTMKVRVQPKIITILCVKRSDGAWLTLRRTHQPFTGHVGFPSGKIHYGERLDEAAVRELREKTGLEHVSLRLRGNVSMRFLDGQETVTHIIGYVFYGEVPVGTETTHAAEYFETLFGNEADLFIEPYIKGNREILEYLKRDEALFFEECEFTSDF